MGCANSLVPVGGSLHPLIVIVLFMRASFHPLIVSGDVLGPFIRACNFCVGLFARFYQMATTQSLMFLQYLDGVSHEVSSVAASMIAFATRCKDATATVARAMRLQGQVRSEAQLCMFYLFSSILDFLLIASDSSLRAAHASPLGP